MTSRAEGFRCCMIDGESFWSRHSTNQKVIKGMQENQSRFDGCRNKAVERAGEKKRKTRERLSRGQFERSLCHVLNSGATPENIGCVVRGIAKFERSLGKIDGGIEVTIIDLSDLR